VRTRAYVTLDGLRGVAALCIVVLHCHRFFGDLTWSSAALAVDLFFVLSGFVLSYAYDERFAGGMTPWQFTKSRIARLYPLYILGTLIGVVTAVLAIHFHRGSIETTSAQFWTSLPFSLLMLPAPGDLLFPLNGPMWSVFYELLVNLVWAIFWKPLRSNRLLILVICAFAVALAATVSSGYTIAYVGADWPTFAGGAFRVGYSFFLGVLLYRLHDRLGVPNIPPLVLLLGLPCVLFLPLTAGMQLIAVLFVLPCFVLFGSKVHPEALLRLTVHQLGAASYAVYTVHYRLYLLVYAAGLQLLQIDVQQFAPWTGIAFTIALVLGCLVVNRYYDEPARRRLAAIWRARIVPEGVTQAP
jgi:peptidoglycan/LPS O-acetylase OafA/YrhL